MAKRGRTKGELMALIYTKEELGSGKVDTGTPMETWKTHPSEHHVMDYTESSIFGELVNLYDKAKQRGIEL